MNSAVKLQRPHYHQEPQQLHLKHTTTAIRAERINQSVNQSISQSINQSINQWCVFSLHTTVILDNPPLPPPLKNKQTPSHLLHDFSKQDHEQSRYLILKVTSSVLYKNIYIIISAFSGPVKSYPSSQSIKAAVANSISGKLIWG